MLSIGANTAQGDLAWKFIQHMTGGARSASDFLGGKVPAYRAIAESEAWQDRGMMPVNKDVILQIGAEPIYSGFGKSWSAWRGYAAEGAGGMNGELDEAFNGRKPIDQAITDFTAYANDILSR
jgi:multiple sugar transport system substrate-binding protein